MSPSPSAVPATAPIPLDLHQAGVLIVDDDTSAVAALEQLLSDYSNKRFATDGEQALKLAQQTLPHLVLLDAEMPGLDGFAVCQALKADPHLAQAIVIFVTAHADPAVEARVFECGAVDFITKPVNAAVLLARVETHLRMRRMAEQLERMAATVGHLQRQTRRDRRPVC